MNNRNYWLLIISFVILTIILSLIGISFHNDYNLHNAETISSHNIVQDEIKNTKSNTNVVRVSKPANGDYFSIPSYSPDGQIISFTTRDHIGITILDKDGSNTKILTKDIGAGYKYVWSLDSKMIAYRGTKFEQNARIQYIGVIDLEGGTTEVISTLLNSSLQPPFWKYSEKGKQVGFVLNGKIEYSKMYSFSSENYVQKFNITDANKFLYYHDENLFLIEDDSVKNKLIEGGLDPVFSPSRQSFVYSKWNKLFLFTFKDNTQTFLDNGYHPAWSPDGSRIVYHKSIDDGEKIIASDLFILDVVNLSKERLTNTNDIIEVDPSWNPDGKTVLYCDEKTGSIYSIIL